MFICVNYFTFYNTLLYRCPDDYIGIRCEEKYSLCGVANPCVGNSTCTDKDGSATCQCRDGKFIYVGCYKYITINVTIQIVCLSTTIKEEILEHIKAHYPKKGYISIRY